MKAILLTLVLTLFSSVNQLDTLRNAFRKAESDKESAVYFNEVATKSDAIQANLQSAYIGASEIMLSKYHDSPIDKLKQFKKGVKILEEAVKDSPSNIEIRLIRVIIQSNIPSFLTYSDAIASDKKFILESYMSSESDVKQFIKTVAKETSVFNEDELKKLQ